MTNIIYTVRSKMTDKALFDGSEDECREYIDQWTMVLDGFDTEEAAVAFIVDWSRTHMIYAPSSKGWAVYRTR